MHPLPSLGVPETLEEGEGLGVVLFILFMIIVDESGDIFTEGCHVDGGGEISRLENDMSAIYNSHS